MGFFVIAWQIKVNDLVPNHKHKSRSKEKIISLHVTASPLISLMSATFHSWHDMACTWNCSLFFNVLLFGIASVEHIKRKCYSLFLWQDRVKLRLPVRITTMAHVLWTMCLLKKEIMIYLSNSLTKIYQVCRIISGIIKLIDFWHL
mgnify:CR=1 FL=1